MMQMFREITFFTKQYLNNSETVQNNEKWYERWSNVSFFILLLCSVFAVLVWDEFADLVTQAFVG